MLSVYQKSWVGLYYKLTAKETPEGHVTFYESTVVVRKIEYFPSESDRFDISVMLPDKNKLFFLPQNQWDVLPPQPYYPVESLSGIKHGMLVQGYNYTRSPYYVSPFCISFKNNPPNVGPNYLLFNDFLIPNSYDLILGLLTYDDDQDKFNAVCNTSVTLPYDNYISLSNILEFVIKDSNQKIVEFSDNSLLVMSIQVL